jgi:hypothetical protein
MEIKDSKQKVFIEILKACKTLKKNLCPLNEHNKNLLQTLNNINDGSFTQLFFDFDSFYTLDQKLTDLDVCLNDLIEGLENELYSV